MYQSLFRLKYVLDEYSREIDVLSEYLPEQLSEEEIQKIVEEAAAQLGITGGKKNIGKMMGAVMPKVKGIADGKAARQVPNISMVAIRREVSLK